MRLSEALSKIQKKGFIITSHGRDVGVMTKEKYEIAINDMLEHPEGVKNLRVADGDLLFEFDGYYVEIFDRPITLRITEGVDRWERIRRAATFQGPAIKKLRRVLLKRVRGAKA
ncbi:hypothetical protein [Thermococcus sp.]|uniref:hypothetical protein n=1 Tax=Thermococcus sp. TaxID=35749 RepID=UPI0025E16490|nr:hypothetical protein [Thermococcus sp.]